MLFDRSRDGTDVVRIALVPAEDEVGPGLRERDGGCGADPGRRSGDERDSAVEPEHEGR